MTPKQEWDGKDRRNGGRMFDKEFYDQMKNMAGNVEHLVSDFKAHKEEDADSFKQVKTLMEFHSKIIYGCIGAFILVEFIVKVMK